MGVSGSGINEENHNCQWKLDCLINWWFYWCQSIYTRLPVSISDAWRCRL